MKEKILKTYNTRLEGLTKAEVNQRLNKYGPNKIEEQERESLLKLFVSQFFDALIALLLVAAAISWLIGNHLDAIVILIVVFINSDRKSVV